MKKKMSEQKFIEDSRICTPGVSVYIRAFLPFLPIYPGRRWDVFVICANNHTTRILINDKNVNLFQQIVTNKGDFLK